MKIPLLLAPLLILATAPRAQTPPCASMNDTNTTVSNAIYSQGAAPNVYGWQYAPTQNLIVQAVQIFTGNNYINYSWGFEIWSDDPVLSLPKARLAGGYAKIITKSSVAAWQGANLDRTVPMIQGNKYWIVFIDPYWSIVPIEPGTGTVLPTARQTSGTWAAIASNALKFRLFCNLLDQQSVKVKGSACASTAGVGTAFANQAPTIGNGAFAIEGSGFPSGAGVALLLGSNPNWPSIPLPGGDPSCFVYTDILLTIAGLAGTGTTRDPVAAAGEVVFSLPVPANPALSGGVVPVQIAGIDLASTYALPIVTSNALLVTLR